MIRDRLASAALDAVALTAVGLGLTVLVGGCAAPPRASTAERNLLVLVVDALRPDHLGSFGYRHDTSPTLDALAREGAFFTRCRSASHFTRASVPSIFTGYYPLVHGVIAQSDRLNEGFETLAERLRTSGYATAAYMPNPSLRREFDFGQGFDVYDDEVLVLDESIPMVERYETARRIQARALRFLDELTEPTPYFLYLHYRDVHGPYAPPPPYDRMFAAPAGEEPQRRLTERERSRLHSYIRREDAGTLDFYLSHYDGAIRYVDDRIGEFLAELRRRGLLENTVIVITADHGEAFLERGEWEHGKTMHEEELHVPLILLDAGGRGSGVRVEVPVSGVDLLPTLFELLNAGPPEPGIQGLSLVPLLEGGRIPSREIFADGDHNQSAVWSGDWKMIYGGAERGWSLYDLERDPSESIDRRLDRPEVADRLRELIRRHRRTSLELRRDRPPGHQSFGVRSAAALRALGYL